MPDTDQIHDVLARRAAAVRRRGTRSVRQRFKRLRTRLFFIAQMAISAAVAWLIARHVVGNAQPFFAPVAAIVALGLSFGQRLQRAVQIVMGVAIGVLVGDLAVAVLGSGYWQLALIVFTSMAVTTFLDGGVLATTQAGVQSAVVTILVAAPGQAFSRWIDAVIGGCVALLAATITPASPLERPREQTGSILQEMSSLFTAAAAALRARDLTGAEEALVRARDMEGSLTMLVSLADDGLSVIRSSPFRRGHRPAIQEIADLVEPLDRAARNLRVLIRRASISLRQGEEVPRNYIGMVADLGEITGDMAAILAHHDDLEEARLALYRLAEETTYVTSRPTLSSEVIRAQVRSIVLDLLMVTGLPIEEALAGIPSSYTLNGDADEVLDIADMADESGTAAAGEDIASGRLDEAAVTDEAEDIAADRMGTAVAAGADPTGPDVASGGADIGTTPGDASEPGRGASGPMSATS